MQSSCFVSLYARLQTLYETMRFNWQIYNQKNDSGIALIARLSTWLVVLTGLTMLTGKFISIIFHSAVYNTEQPIFDLFSPFFFILIGLIIANCLLISAPRSKYYRFFLIVAIVILVLTLSFVAIFTAIEFTSLFDNTSLRSNQEAFSIVPASFISIILFFTIGIVLALKLFLNKNKVVLNFVSGLGALLTFLGFVDVLGYFFNVPSIYYHVNVQWSFGTSIGFFFLGISMLCFGGSNTVFTRHFFGKTPSAFVLRIFFPIITAGILFETFLYIFFVNYTGVDASYLRVILTAFAILLTFIVLIIVSKYAFKKADLAEKARETSEAAIRRERILLRTLIDNLPDTIYVKDVNARKVLANKADVIATGLKNESEMIGKSDIDLFNETDGLHGYNQDLEVINSGKAVIDHEKDFITNSGETKWFRTSKFPLLDNDGKIVGLVGIGHDITAKKSNEEHLLLLNHTLQSLNDCVCITDINDNFIFVNNAFLKTYGYSRSELLGKNISIVRKKNEVDMLTPLIHEETLQAGWHGEVLNFKKDGTELQMEISTSQVINELGEVVGLAGVAIDISQRKRMEHELQQSNERYRTLVESQGEGVVLVNLNEEFVFANPAAEQIFEVAAGVLFGKNLSEFTTAASQEIIKKQTALRALNEKSSYEIEIITHKGNSKFLMVTATAQFDKTGNHIGAFGIIRDVTAQKVAENELKRQKYFLETVIESLNHPFYVINADNYMVKLSNSAAKKFFKEGNSTCFGLTRGLDMPCTHKGENCPLHKCVETGSSIKVEQIKKNPNGELEYSDVYAYPIFDADGKVTQIIEYSLDVTERKKIELQLTRQTDELLGLISTRDKFFSIIAHDLRSPFNAILGFSDLLSSEFDDFDRGTIHEYVLEIDKASKSAFNLLENLLEWARTQTDKIEFAPMRFNSTELINLTLSSAYTQASKKNISLEANLPESLFIEADKNMIYTVLRNLISNAIKFTPENGQIKVKAWKTEQDFMFSVTDSGIGISKENIEKLFKIDTAYTKPGTNNEKGTGLGLILCKEFIDKHHGKIGVESDLPNNSEGNPSGSTFYFSIPQQF